VPWEVTVDNAFPWSFLDTLVEKASEGNLLVGLLKGYTKTLQSMSDESKQHEQRESEFSRYASKANDFLLCDVYCIVAMMANESIVEHDNVTIDVELDGSRSRGNMMMDWFNRLGEKKDAGAVSRVVLKMDKGLVGKMIEDAFLSGESASLFIIGNLPEGFEKKT
jgi:hypothetical protein